MNIRLPAMPTAGHRLLAEPADPVEVDEEVERLEDHRDQHEAGRLEQMPGDGAGRQILHKAICLE